MGKVTVKDAVKPEGFKPFTLEITVETPEDYRELWHRFNASNGDIEKTVKLEEFKINSIETDLASSVWYALDGVDTGDYRQKFIEKKNITQMIMTVTSSNQVT